MGAATPPDSDAARVNASLACSPLAPAEVVRAVEAAAASLEAAALPLLAQVVSWSLIAYEHCAARALARLSATRLARNAASSTLLEDSLHGSSSPRPDDHNYQGKGGAGECAALLAGALALHAHTYPRLETDPFVTHNFGVLKQAAGDEGGAESLFTRAALVLSSPDPGPYVEVGLRQRLRGDKRAAIATLVRGLEAPSLRPTSRNEYAVLTNLLSLLIDFPGEEEVGKEEKEEDVRSPPSALRRILGHPALDTAAEIYPHLALYRAYLGLVTAEWGLGAQEGRGEALRRALGHVLTVVLAGWDVPAAPALSAAAATPPLLSALQRWTGLRHGPQTPFRTPVDLARSLAGGPSGQLLADSLGNAAAFELAFLDVPQWTLPLVSALLRELQRRGKAAGTGTGTGGGGVGRADANAVEAWYRARRSSRNITTVAREGKKDGTPGSSSSPPPPPSPRLRLAYISPDFRRHAIGQMMLGPLAVHDRGRITVAAYHTKEVGNKFGYAGVAGDGRKGAAESSLRWNHAGAAGNRTTAPTEETRQPAAPATSVGILRPRLLSPDWAARDVDDLFTTTEWVDKTRVNWSEWARTYTATAGREALRRATSDAASSRALSASFDARPATVPALFCDASLWTQTSRLAAAADSFFVTRVWPGHGNEAEVVDHMARVTRPHILIDLGGPTLGGLAAVARARPAVLTAHYLSGPLSIGDRAAADYALVDHVVLPPDLAFHAAAAAAPSASRTTTRVQRSHAGGGDLVSLVASSTGGGLLDPAAVAAVLAQAAPHTLSLRRNSSGSSSQNRLIVRDFTEALVYLPVPFQANTFPTAREARRWVERERDGGGGDGDGSRASGGPRFAEYVRRWQDRDSEPPMSPCAPLLAPVLSGGEGRGGPNAAVAHAPAPPHPSRAHCPDRSRIVLGALHATHKVTPAAFSSWMGALRQLPRAELWLLLHGPSKIGFRDRVLDEARAAGIHPSRVVFFPETPRERFWELLPCLDVFLDAWVYGAHSTGADALRFGVPVVTLQSPAFAGRVVSSLITALGNGAQNGMAGVAKALFVTHSSAEYEETVVRLGGGGGGGGGDGGVPARHLKLLLQPLVGGEDGAGARAETSGRNAGRRSANAKDEEEAAAEPASPPAPFDYRGHTRALERAYRAMWEARAAVTGGFPDDSLTADGAAALTLMHVVVVGE
jgi:hypothetical protein